MRLTLTILTALLLLAMMSGCAEESGNKSGGGDFTPPPLPVSITTTTLPDATLHQPYSCSVAATGGAGSGYSWSIVAGVLPPGLLLGVVGQSDVAIDGTPTQAGTFAFTIQAQDPAGATGQANLQITVVAVPLAISTPPDLPDATTTVPYSQLIAATGGSAAGYTWSIAWGELPPGLALSASGTPEATLSGTPTAFGRFYFEVEVTDSAANTATLEMNVIVVVSGAADSWVASFSLAQDLGAASVFTGSRILQFGGEFTAGNSGQVLFPGAGTVGSMSAVNAPAGRIEHSAVWTGREMIVFGGRDGSSYLNDAHRYDPFADTWTACSASGAPAARANHTAVWTGAEMVVIGGHDGAFAPFKDGAAYDPATDTWRALSAAPSAVVGRERHKAVWSGTQVIVWGGFDDSGLELYDGAAWDPATDQWVHVTATGAPSVRAYESVVVWTGSKLFVWGGHLNPYMEGAMWDPTANSWSGVGTWAVIRRQPAGVATPGGVFVWGGLDHFGTFAQNDGEMFVHSANNWSTIATPSLGGRFNAKAFWTGRQIIVWGGKDFGFAGTNPQSDGELYNP